MKRNVVIVDNFYNNPYEVREFALSQEFSVYGNYPGQRTQPDVNSEVRDIIQDLIYFNAGKITNWEGEYTGAYQYTTSRDRSWIHADNTTNWAGVCYLTPDAPVTAGTGLFRHKETGLMKAPEDEALLDKIYNDAQDVTKWDLVDVIGNVFNRLVLYRGDIFHSSLDYFGTNKENGRLFQTFFFNTEF